MISEKKINKMKKLLVLFMSLIFVFGAASCTEKPTGIPYGQNGGETALPVSAEPTVPPTAVPTEEPTPASTPVTAASLNLKEGDSSNLVIGIQMRLMALDYMGSDEPEPLFGSTTTEAIKRFQRRNGLAVTGRVRAKDYAVLMSSQALVYSPGLGDRGEDITAMQERLHELGYLDAVTGVFDRKTEDAFVLFKDKNMLTPDAVVDAMTIEYLYYDEAVPNIPYIGSQSEQIMEYQQILHDLGYLFSEPNGIYDKETANAVKRFQSRNDLVVDGYLGPTTTELLTSENARFNTLTYTMSGDDVLSMQTRLMELNYLSADELTGYFDMITENAVRAFQSRNELEENGAVTKETRDALFSDSAEGADPIHASTPGMVLTPTQVPQITPRPQYPGIPSVPGGSAQAKITNLLSIARSKLGCPYVRGGKGPDSFDCSGFVYWCLNRAGVSVSYMTSIMWRTTQHFPRINSISNIRAGDIIVFDMGEYTGHVGIAAGNGMMYDASSSKGMVVYRSYDTNYFHRTFCCAYRIFQG